MRASAVIGADDGSADRPARWNARTAPQLSRDLTATDPLLLPGTCRWRPGDPTEALALVRGVP